jgi:hypothetical protein
MGAANAAVSRAEEPRVNVEAVPYQPVGELLTWEPPTWEYCVGRLPGYTEQECMAKLNALGAEGWELVCVLGGDSRGPAERYVFKRQRREEDAG